MTAPKLTPRERAERLAGFLRGEYPLLLDGIESAIAAAEEAERDACAQVAVDIATRVDDIAKTCTGTLRERWSGSAAEARCIADAIRARGK